MLETEKVTYLLELAGLSSKSRALVGEMLVNVDRLASVTEKELLQLEWVKKNGEIRQLINTKQAGRIFQFVEQHTNSDANNKTILLRKYAESQLELRDLINFVSVFVDKRVATRFGNQIGGFCILPRKTPQE